MSAIMLVIFLGKDMKGVFIVYFPESKEETFDRFLTDVKYNWFTLCHQLDAFVFLGHQHLVDSP